MAGTKTIVPGRGTATITVSDYANLGAGATVTVNGIVLTMGAEWSNATGNNATAASIAGAINTATATTLCTAAAVATNVVTISANTIGSAGDVSLATSDAVRLLKSGTALTGGNSGIVGTSGATQVIYGVEVQAGADTCNIDVYNGTSASGTLVLRLSCTASVSNNFEFLGGVILPSGCFIDITVTAIANPPTAVTITYKQL